MKNPIRLALPALFPLVLSAADQPWREVTFPTVAETAAAFPQPPREYDAIHWAIWGGQQSKDRILADIEQVNANGGGVYMIDNSGGMMPKYFTPEYLDLVKFVVAECKKRGMKVWIEDDAGYPDGMAGGLISRDYPQLGMQAVVADARYSVAAGQTLKMPLPPDTLGILAYNRGAHTTTVVPLPVNGELRWTAPDPGTSELVFVRHVYRSSPTRYTNRADGTRDKDSLYSLTDYLDPVATQTYLKLIHDTYAKIVGDEFGKTILGFRGDEPDYTGFMPWTPKLLETFQRVKGYDLQPYLVRFFEPDFTPEVRRAKADYWDVWSAMFRDNFFKPQSDWCKARNMEYMVHLNHEELMLNLNRGEDLIRNEGSFFRDMRYADVPGIDNLNQIGPGIVADFPKLAASAAHVFGHPMAWSEEGGGLGQSGKYVADYQFVRGLNYLNVRGLNSVPGTDAPPLLNPSAATAWYVDRAGYLLAVGRPAAQVALYHPTDSLWLGDKEADDVTVKLTTELMEHQVDFDQIDADSLVSVCTQEGGTLKNLSGQVYRAVVIPTSLVISRPMLDRLRAFAAAGGKVVFVGRTPSMVIDRTFLHPEPGAPDLGFATLEPTPEITARVIAALPRPDVKLDAPAPALKYIHRSLRDGDVYFFLNESGEALSRTVTLDGKGEVQIWDATSGMIHPLAAVAPADGQVAVPLALEPQESRFIVIGPAPGAAKEPVPAGTARQTIATLDGDWALTLGDRRFTTPLKSWETLGAPSFTGTAAYRKEFTAPSPLPAGRRVFLDLGDVHELAAARLNGTELAARPWPPYRWDVTEVLRPGANTLEVQVQVRSSGNRGGFGGGRARRGGAAEAPAAEHGFAPTGVPGGLTYDAPGGGQRGRGGPRAGGAPAGNLNAYGQPTPPPVVPASGILGPVRLVAP